MDAVKNEIIDRLITRLQLINGQTLDIPGYSHSPHTFFSNVGDRVFGQLKYLDQINDFPTICLYESQPEERTEIGGEIIYADLILMIRGYVNGEDPQTLCDNLIEDILYIIGSFRYSQEYFDYCRIQDLKVLRVGTDEGLLEPYGVCEVEIDITYEATP